MVVTTLIYRWRQSSQPLTYPFYILDLISSLKGCLNEVFLALYLMEHFFRDVRCVYCVGYSGRQVTLLG